MTLTPNDEAHRHLRVTRLKHEKRLKELAHVQRSIDEVEYALDWACERFSEDRDALEAAALVMNNIQEDY